MSNNKLTGGKNEDLDKLYDDMVASQAFSQDDLERFRNWYRDLPVIIGENYDAYEPKYRGFWDGFFAPFTALFDRFASWRNDRS